MIEKLSMNPEIPDPKASQLIFVRHGDTKYTGIPPDLTEKGIKQVKNTAQELEPHLRKFDCLMWVTSPLPRALGTADVFSKQLGLSPDWRHSRAARGADIYNLKGYNDYDSEHNTGIFGEMWLTDPFLEFENPYVEARSSVEKRALKFLYHYGRIIGRKSYDSGQKIGALIITHMEIGNNFLHGIYQGDSFPIKEKPAMDNAEVVIVELNNPLKDEYTFIARGISQRRFIDQQTGRLVTY